MTIVDTWGWDKLKLEVDSENQVDSEDFKKDVDTKVRTALYDFERFNGIRPNRITMGYYLVDELRHQFYSDTVPVGTLEAVALSQELGIRYEYEGIPIKIDCDNPDALEVGYMIKWMENKYE